MTLLGELFGYDARDNDLIGVNRDPGQNCVVCGIACSAHTAEMESACLSQLHRFLIKPTNSKQAGG